MATMKLAPRQIGDKSQVEAVISLAQPHVGRPVASMAAAYQLADTFEIPRDTVEFHSDARRLLIEAGGLLEYRVRTQGEERWHILALFRDPMLSLCGESLADLPYSRSETEPPQAEKLCHKCLGAGLHFDVRYWLAGDGQTQWVVPELELDDAAWPVTNRKVKGRVLDRLNLSGVPGTVQLRWNRVPPP